jgi:hypothetical protein
MPVAASKIEIRYRRSDSVGQWQFVTIPAGQDAVVLSGVERGVQYQIEARSVALSGAASDWVAQTHIVGPFTLGPIIPSGFAATSLTDGVHLTWTASDVQRSDVEYEIQRTGDIAGSPDPAGWATLTRIRSLRYTDGVTDGVVRWYRVRSSTYGGVATAFSTAVNSQGKPPAAPTDNLIKNGDFELGLANWGTSGGWGGSLSAITSVSSSSFPRGSNALNCAATLLQSPESQIFIPVDITKTYFAEGWVKISAPLTGGAAVYLGFNEYDGSKTHLIHNSGGSGAMWCLANNLTSTPSNGWLYVSAEIVGSASLPTDLQFNSSAKYVKCQALLNWSSGTPQIIQVQGLRISEVAAGSVRAIKLLQKGISTDLKNQSSVVPGTVTRNPFSVVSFDDTLGNGCATKITWVAITVYNPDNTTVVVPASTDSTQQATVPSPTLSTVAGGTKGARTYFVRISFMIDAGNRGWSAEASIAVPANSLLKVTSPANTPPWSGYAVHIATASNGEVWESTTAMGGNDFGIPFGTDFTEPTAALATTGPKYSSITSHGLDGDIHTAIGYAQALMFYPYWDTVKSLVRFFGVNGSGLTASTVSTPDNVRGMYLDKNIALSGFGLPFTTLTVAQGAAGTTTGGGGFGGCVLEGTNIVPLGVSALSYKEPNTEWVEIELEDGRTLTATPDHPIYCDRGKTPLGQIEIGEEVITDCGMVRVARKEFKTFPANKECISMPKGHLYYANGIMSHNFKLPQN